MSVICALLSFPTCPHSCFFNVVHNSVMELFSTVLLLPLQTYQQSDSACRCAQVNCCDSFRAIISCTRWHGYNCVIQYMALRTVLLENNSVFTSATLVTQIWSLIGWSNSVMRSVGSADDCQAIKDHTFRINSLHSSCNWQGRLSYCLLTIQLETQTLRHNRVICAAIFCCSKGVEGSWILIDSLRLISGYSNLSSRTV